MLKTLAGLVIAIGMTASSIGHAATVAVSAKATGGFGSSNDGFQPMVAGIALLGGQSVQITATGLIGLCNPCSGLEAIFASLGPNGITVTGFPSVLFPLEEGNNDNPLLTDIDPASDSANAGALIGAFVPAAIVADASFSASDTDIGGDIVSPALFLIGAGPFLFTAPEDGTLFFGINETFAANDVGSFTVTVDRVTISTPVPVPATLALLGPGLVGLMMLRRRRKQG